MIFTQCHDIHEGETGVDTEKEQFFDVTDRRICEVLAFDGDHLGER
jgi:hypothetical protein